MMGFLHFFARHGRMVLVAGLVAGLVFPWLAQFLKQWLWLLVAMLLFVAALRIGYQEAIGRLGDISRSLPLLLLFQLATPLCAIAVFTAFGHHSAIATAIILCTTACSISGSANLAIMTGNNPAPALRLLIAGTAILPLTAIPVFFLLPELGSITAVLSASLKLLVLIGGATGSAFVVRKLLVPEPDERQLKAIDGLSSILMAVLVIGLMSAVGPALRNAPQAFVTTLAIATAVNFGLQTLAWFGLKAFVDDNRRAAVSIVAGNRNTALFLAALPTHVTDPLLLYIGCYQIPMYLTPLVLGRLYQTRPKTC